MQLNDSLGRTAGDALLSGLGEIVRALSKSYGFIGCNRPDWFLGLFENCSVSKAELFVEMFNKSLQEFNKKQVELQAKCTVTFSNSTAEEIYDVRKLIVCTSEKMG